MPLISAKQRTSKREGQASIGHVRLFTSRGFPSGHQRGSQRPTTKAVTDKGTTGETAPSGTRYISPKTTPTATKTESGIILFVDGTAYASPSQVTS